MTNQTMILSIAGVDASSHQADVTPRIDAFIRQSIAKGLSNFQIQPVVVTLDSHGDMWYTVQVNFYDPAVQEA